MKKLLVLVPVLLIFVAFVACGTQTEELPELTDRRFQGFLSAYDGMVVAMLDDDTTAIIDIFSDEEMFRFCADTYHFSSTQLSDGLVRLLRLDDGRFILVDILSGDEIFPLDEGYSSGMPKDGMAPLFRMSDGQAVIDLATGAALIDLATGEEIIPFGTYTNILLSNGMAIVHVLENDKLPFPLSHARGVIDIASGEEIIPIGMYEEDLHWTYTVCGTVFLGRFCPGQIDQNFDVSQSVGIVDVRSGTEVIPLGLYMNARMITEDIAIVLRGPMRERAAGILEISSGRYLVPLGRYDEIKHYCYETGAVFARLGSEVGVFDIVTGEELIPFGYYDRFGFVDDGIMAVSRDGVWWFEHISNLLNRP